MILPYFYSPCILILRVSNNGCDVSDLRITVQLHWRPEINAEGFHLPVFVNSALIRDDSQVFDIKATTLAFKTTYGEGVVPRN